MEQRMSMIPFSFHSISPRLRTACRTQPQQRATATFVRQYLNAAHLVLLNDLHPVPTPRATRAVRENFALARGGVPHTSVVHPLMFNARSFTSFSGAPREFSALTRKGPVIALFYKPASGPYSALRDRLHEVREKWRPNERDAAAPNLEQQQQQTAAASSASASIPEESLRFADGITDNERELCDLVKRQFHAKYDGVIKNVNFLCINTNENSRLTALHDVRSLPTFVAYKDGKMVARVEGAHVDELMQMLTAMTDSPGEPAEESDGNQQTG